MHKESFIRSTVAEDIGRGDLFSFFGETKNVTAYILSKGNGVFAGREYIEVFAELYPCLLYTSPSPRDRTRSRMPSSA